MFALRLAVLCFLGSGCYGFSQYLFNIFNNCNPPERIVGRFCGSLLDDINGDGYINNTDYSTLVAIIDYDGNHCNIQPWEMVMYQKCRYGWSEEYARFLFRLFDFNKDGEITFSEFPPISFTKDAYLLSDYNRYKNFCSSSHWNNDIDRVRCPEVLALKQEDIKCDEPTSVW